MAKQFKLLAGIILIFAFLIAVNPVFAECSPDSSGACIANETTPTEPGNYTYTVCIGNSCKNITVSVQSDAISVLIDPSTVEFGQILAGGGAIGDVSVTNLGNQTISSLTAETSGTRLSATLDSTEILPQQTVVITVLLATLGTDSAGSKFESVTLAGTAPSQPFGVTIPVRYAVFRNDTQNYTNYTQPGIGILTAVPDTVSFGEITPGGSTLQFVNIINTGDKIASGITVASVGEITATIDKAVLLPGEIANLQLVLLVPASLSKGTYTKNIFVSSAEGSTAEIAVEYTVSERNVFCPVVTLPTCSTGSHYETRKDDKNCSYAICVSDTVKKECPAVSPLICAENEQLKSSVNSEGCKTYQCVPTPPFISKERLLSPGVLFTIIIIIGATLFVVFVVAVREGWIDLNDYPLLRDWLRKAGLGPIFEREVEVSRFTPRPPPFTGIKKPPVTPPSPVREEGKPMRQLTPGEKEKLEKYMKAHPEYAAWVKKRYGLK